MPQKLISVSNKRYKYPITLYIIEINIILLGINQNKHENINIY